MEDPELVVEMVKVNMVVEQTMVTKEVLGIKEAKMEISTKEQINYSAISVIQSATKKIYNAET